MNVIINNNDAFQTEIRVHIYYYLKFILFYHFFTVYITI